MTTRIPPWRSTRQPAVPRSAGLPDRRPRRAGPRARVGRGVVAGVLSTALAAASHVAAGVSAPTPVVVAVAVAIAVGACVLLAGCRMGPVRLGAAVTLSQGVYHLLFSLPGGNTAGAPARPGRQAHLAEGHSHSPPGTLPPELPPAETGHWAMLLTHLVAVVATYLLLRHGEQTWWSLVDALGARIHRILASDVPQISAPRPLGPSLRFLSHELHDLGSTLGTVTPRGPPVPVS